MFVEVKIEYALLVGTFLRFRQVSELLQGFVPLSDCHEISLLFGASSHKNKESHARSILFVLQREVDEVRSQRNKFYTLEQRPSLPELVVNSKLHPNRRFKQQQRTQILEILVSKFLMIFHFNLLNVRYLNLKIN